MGDLAEPLRYLAERGNKKAPSGRELSAELTEGERVRMKLVQIPSSEGSFHRKRSASLPEGGIYGRSLG